LFIKKNQILAIGVLVFALTSISCSVAETFSNNDPSAAPKSLGDVIEWRMTKDPSPERIAIELSDDCVILILSQVIMPFGLVTQPT